jgi:hypothetical protein
MAKYYKLLNEKYYKLLNEDGTTPLLGFQWPMPKGDKPGKWLPPIEGKLIPCGNGYHVLRLEDLLEWYGRILVEVEIKRRAVRSGNKSVVRQARVVRVISGWNDRNLRLFAADCAERVLPIWEKQHPKDMRPREAIKAARAFVNGKITFSDWAAARSAARSSSFDAFGTAACAAAQSAVCASAQASAQAAAQASARNDPGKHHTSYAVEWKWQKERLKEYIEGEVKPA